MYIYNTHIGIHVTEREKNKSKCTCRIDKRRTLIGASGEVSASHFFFSYSHSFFSPLTFYFYLLFFIFFIYINLECKQRADKEIKSLLVVSFSQSFSHFVGLKRRKPCFREGIQPRGKLLLS